MIPRKSRARKVLGVLGAVVAVTVTFAASAVAAVVVHLDVPAVRRLVATEGTSILRGQLAGDVAIERIGALGLHGVAGVRVRVKDPSGMQVLFVDGARVRTNALAIVRSYLFGSGDIRIVVDEVAIDHVDAAIDGDGTPAGGLRIVNAFLPKVPSPSKPPDPNARGVRVEAPQIALRHAWIHGTPPAAPPVDAELAGLGAHAHVDPSVVAADLDRVDLVARGLHPAVDPKGRIGAHASLPLDPAHERERLVEAWFDGEIAGTPTNADARMVGERIDARADVRGATGTNIRRTFGELPIRETVSAHAEVHGTTTQMKAKANVALGRGTADAEADVDLRDGTKIDATLAARHLDARAALASAPATDVNVDARAHVALAKNGGVAGEGAVHVLPSRLENDELPQVHITGDFANDTGRAVALVFDPRMPTAVNISLDRVRGTPIVDAQLDSHVPEVGRLPRVNGLASGAADIHARAHVDLASKTVDGTAEVKAAHLVHADDVRIEDARVVTRAYGALARPAVEVGVHAGGVTLAGTHVGAANVRGKIELGKAIAVRDALVDVVREGYTVTASAKRVVVGGPRLSVEGAEIDGLGEPIHADFTRDAASTRIALDAPAIDLPRIAAIAGRKNDVKKGTLAISGDVTLRKDSASGELHANVDSATAFGLDGAKVALDTKLDDRDVDLHLEAALAQAGTLSLHTRKLVLGGSPSDPRAWRRAKGSASFVADVDLKKIAEMVPPRSLPVGELAGRLVLVGRIRRDSGDVPPEVSLHGHTAGLVVSGKTEPEVAVGATRVKGVAPSRTQGLDGAFDAKVDATSGFGEIGFHVWDALGTVVVFDAKADLPYQELVSNPDAAAKKLEAAPLVAKLVVPRREIAKLPAVLGTRGFGGTIDAQLDVHGTALEPKVELVAHGRGVRAPALAPGLATDTDVTLAYDGEAGDLAVKTRLGGQDALDLTAHADVRAADLVRGTAADKLAWKGSAKAKLVRFPLDALGPLADVRVRGRVSGEATIADLHDDAKLHARLGLEALHIGRARYENGFVVVDAAGGKLDANARLVQTDGWADVHASAGMRWGASLAPALDDGTPIDARFQAKAFRAAAAAPFVRTVMSELDGRIDADASAHVDPKTKDTKLDGRIVFREGTLQLVAAGDELQNARANVTLHPDGRIDVDDVFARSVDGRIYADARVKLRGLALDNATANVRIPKDHRFDVGLQGAPIGEVWGNAHVDARSSPDGKRLAVKVDVPTFEVRLSEAMKSGIQELGPQQKIRAGVYRDAHTFVKLPLDKEDLDPKTPKKNEDVTTTSVDVRLGDITVVYGRMARLSLTGAPHVELGAGEPKVTGQVNVKQGKIDVQGKKFDIEKCTVTFQEHEPSNPIVMATAGWEADDGSKIYADFVGPVKTGKVTLRSEPARPRNEILAIILFGTADGANAQPAPPGQAPDGTTKAAVGVGGGVAAQGLSEAMDDLTGVEATARIDSSRANNPAPELEVQISRRVSLAVQHVLGNPPITEPDKNLATVDWRFARNWSLETTFGDRGKAQVDAVWQKRY